MAYKTGEPNVKTLNNVVIKLRNDTAANWASSAYVLAKGELGLDTTNSVIRIGDGVNTFSNLPNATAVIAEASAYDATTNTGGKDRNHGGIKVNGTDINVFTLTVADTSVIGAVLSTAVDTNGYATINGDSVPGYVTVNADGSMTVKVVSAAEKLQTARTITFAESAANAGDTDATGNFTFDGSANVTTQLTLVNSGVTANDGVNDDPYVAVKVDAKGRVVEGTEATDFIATAQNTDVVNAKTSTLGLVKSAFDEKDAANADSNVGKVAIDANGNMSVTRVAEANTFHTARTLSISGAGTGSVSFDGSADADIALTLTDTSVTSATAYNSETHTATLTKVTVNNKGLVVGGEATIAAADVNDFNSSVQTIIDNNAVVSYGEGTAAATAGKLVKLNSSGKISDDFIPALGIGQVYSTNDYTNLTTNKATYVATNNIQAGDIVVVEADITGLTTEVAISAAKANDGTYIYVDNTNSGNGTFVLIKAPGAAIQSVNGHVGPTVTLITNDIAETAGTIADSLAGGASDTTNNRYFTQARVKGYLDNISVRSTFSDGAHVVLDTDSFVINAGDSTGSTTGA